MSRAVVRLGRIGGMPLALRTGGAHAQSAPSLVHALGEGREDPENQPVRRTPVRCTRSLPSCAHQHARPSRPFTVCAGRPAKLGSAGIERPILGERGPAVVKVGACPRPFQFLEDDMSVNPLGCEADTQEAPGAALPAAVSPVARSTTGLGTGPWTGPDGRGPPRRFRGRGNGSGR